MLHPRRLSGATENVTVSASPLQDQFRGSSREYEVSKVAIELIQCVS